MKRFMSILLLTFVTATLAAQTAEDSVALANAPWKISAPRRGMTVMTVSMRLFDSPQTISVVRYDGRRYRTRLLQPEACGLTTDFAAESGSLAAINGSYFDVKKLIPSTYVAVGHKPLFATYPNEMFRVNGVVALRGRKMEVIMCDTADYAAVTKRYDTVLAAGPVLLDDGREITYDRSGGFWGRHPRSLIGTSARGEVMMIVVDGRFKGRAEGMTIAELAFLARQLGLCEAINLDGGGSSTLWTPEEGIINHPYDNKLFDHGGERHVVNCFVSSKR